MRKQVPLDIVFLNQPSHERVFKVWAEIECSRMGLRLETLAVERREKNERSA